MAEPLIALLVHAHPSVAEAYRRALGGIPLFRVQSTGSQFSAGYDGRSSNGIAKRYPTVREAVRHYAPEAADAERVILIGFSAGCWALRSWLLDADSRELAAAVVFVDGLHAGGSDGRAALGDHHRGVLQYADRAARGERICVISHSQIVPPGYASTRATADAVIQSVGGTRQSRLEDYHRNGLHVFSVAGADAQAHRDQLNPIGPEVCRMFVRPEVERLHVEHGGVLTERRVSTSPGMAPITSPDVPLGERAVSWMARQMEREDPPTARTLASWFAHATREVNGEERKLGISSGNHCAITVCRAAAESLLPGELVPHGQRAAAKEIMADAIEAQAWIPARELRSGMGHRVHVGDLVVYDRSVANRPETAWWGHVDRITGFRDRAGALCSFEDSVGYDNLGANEGPGGRWRWQRGADATPWGHSRILGVVTYPALDPAPLVQPCSNCGGSGCTACGWSGEQLPLTASYWARTELDRRLLRDMAQRADLPEVEASWWLEVQSEDLGL